MFRRLAALLLSVTFAAPATAFDMRDCPLDRVTFLEPWSGTAFTVKTVAQDRFWICGAMRVPDAEGRGECSGPFGNIALGGTVGPASGEGRMVPVTFVWQVIKGAPCCGWHAYLPDDSGLTDLLSSAAAPDRPLTLSAISAPVIELDEYSHVSDGIEDNFGALVPLVCRTE